MFTADSTAGNGNTPGDSAARDAEFDRLYAERRAQEQADTQAAVDAKLAEDDAKNAKLAKSQTVKFSVMQTNGQPIHLCVDGEWRTNEELTKIGVED